MKGIINIMEFIVVGSVLMLALSHFFPRYNVGSGWDRKILEIRVKDTLTTIDRLDKVYDFSMDIDEFNDFMENLYLPGSIEGAMIWWREVEGLPGAPVQSIPYFVKGYKESMMDVIVDVDGDLGLPLTFYNYTFTLGIGYPF